jgi:outer membrane protein assembly factor BamB
MDDRKRVVLGALVCGVVAAIACAAPHAAWRGDGTGCYADANPPLKWSADENVIWKAPLPNWSNASPAIWGDRIFVCAEPCMILCLSRADGSTLWKDETAYKDVAPPEDKGKVEEHEKRAGELRRKRGELHKQLRELGKKRKQNPDDEALKAQEQELKGQQREIDAERSKLTYSMPDTHNVNGYSTPTPVTDGKQVFVCFGTGIVAAYDMDGNRQWIRLVERPTQGWGHSASPVLAGGVLVVQIKKVHGLDAKTGETKWEAPSRERWGSLVASAIGDEDVVVTANGELIRARDGEILVRGIGPALQYCAPVVEDGLAYFIQHGGSAARLPESADTASKVEPLWKTMPKKERYYASPVVVDGLVYAITQKSDFSVIDATNGDVVYTKNLDFGRGTVYPSITLAGGKLFVSSDNGTTLILEPGREYKELARNTLEPFRSSPVFLEGRMYVRGLKHLYCIGE